jgi:hypothetical protein
VEKVTSRCANQAQHGVYAMHTGGNVNLAMLMAETESPQVLNRVKHRSCQGQRLRTWRIRVQD